MVNSNTNKLTDGQKRLIDQYYKEYGYRHMKSCILKVVKCKVDSNTMDDYIGVAEEAICKAARNFQNEKGMKFSSFVQMNIMSAMATHIRDSNTHSRKPIGGVDSLDRVVDTNSGTTFGELLEHVENEEIASNINNISNYVKSLSKMETVVLVLRLLGVQASEIIENLAMPKWKIEDWLNGISNYERKNIVKKKGVIK